MSELDGTTPSVWVGCLACYNDGFLYGDWPDFAMQLADDLDRNTSGAEWPYSCIDWDRAARELMFDYNAHNGYYFRVI